MLPMTRAGRRSRSLALLQRTTSLPARGRPGPLALPLLHMRAAWRHQLDHSMLVGCFMALGRRSLPSITHDPPRRDCRALCQRTCTPMGEAERRQKNRFRALGMRILATMTTTGLGSHRLLCEQEHAVRTGAGAQRAVHMMGTPSARQVSRPSTSAATASGYSACSWRGQSLRPGSALRKRARQPRQQLPRGSAGLPRSPSPSG